MKEIHYRLARLSGQGLQGHDRHAYSSLGRALDVAKKESECGVAMRAGIDDDTGLVDGQWIYRPDVGYRDSGPYRSRGGPTLDGSVLVVESQPRSWIGRTFVDGLGNGKVWTGDRLLPVRRYRIEVRPEVPESHRGLYAAAVAATRAWWESAGRGVGAHQTPAVISLTGETGKKLRETTEIPWQTDHAVLLPGDEETGEWPIERPYIGADGAIHPPRRLVPIARDTLLRLETLDIHQPRAERTRYYRWTRVTADGVQPIDREVYTSADAAGEPATSDSRGYGIADRYYALCWTVGLPADAEHIDQKPFATDVRRTATNRFAGIASVRRLEMGNVIARPDGSGILYDGHTLRRLQKMTIHEPGRRAHGLPVWALAALKRAKVTPADLNVQGIVIPTGRGQRAEARAREMRAMGLPEDTRAVLFLRMGARRIASAIPLDREDLKRLKEKSVEQIDTSAGNEPLPYGRGTPGPLPAVKPVWEEDTPATVAERARRTPASVRRRRPPPPRTTKTTVTKTRGAAGAQARRAESSRSPWRQPGHWRRSSNCYRGRVGMR